LARSGEPSALEHPSEEGFSPMVAQSPGASQPVGAHEVAKSSGSQPVGAPAVDLDEAAQLRAALLRLGRRLRAIDAGSGLTPAELSVLGSVVRSGAIRPSALAQAEGMNPTMLSRLLARLVDGGALERQDDPADRRVALVTATPLGRHVHRQLRVARAKALWRHVGQLPVEQQRAISAALPALEALVELVECERR